MQQAWTIYVIATGEIVAWQTGGDAPSPPAGHGRIDGEFPGHLWHVVDGVPLRKL